MNMNDTNQSETLLEDLGDDMIIDQGDVSDVPSGRARRDIPQMMRKIPVTLTLEVGSARISLEELMAIGPESVIELDMLAGEPLVIKVNGTPIGRAEVVVAGENYGLKVIDLDGLNLDLMTA
ncbi:FliM/FliN family flagellar motor switch protein [Janthinobacterium sp. FW305-129]|uniref:FliM/FliN family flagellar motor switch protein n=1 Tax=Janthinobacterium sp. FW305-129 TaxID=2775054 RepID=UPI001E3B43D2|nr:FliM/FliN family flagellar motor switch protein [Janthinobacterium sp. FW305-129]MCC7600541.1 FliM/FliN family flagellar motor switch protein [Janthinobacterium sp. FW305-129]